MSPRFKRSATACALLTLLGACGGGGDAAPDVNSSEPRTRLDMAATVATTAAASAVSTLSVRARGSAAAGQAPRMEVMVDGVRAAGFDVGPEWQDYAVPLDGPLSAGARIDVVFVNDGAIFTDGVMTQDRNLYVDAITVDGRELIPEQALFDRGWGEGAFDGLDLLAGRADLNWDGALRFVLPVQATDEEDTRQVLVRAGGSAAGGEGARMVVRVDGQIVGHATVGPIWQTYRFVADRPVRGEALIDVAFVNDAVIAGEDRNLFVAWLAVGTHNWPATAAVYDRGPAAAAFDGADVVSGRESLWWDGALRFSVFVPTPQQIRNGTPDADLIIGTPGVDQINGQGGDDALYGDQGADVIYGGSGDDQLFGGVEADWLVGGPGNDYLMADGGDTLFYALGDGSDLIAGPPQAVAGNTLRFDDGIRADAVGVSAEQGALVISVGTDRITLQSFLRRGQRQVGYDDPWLGDESLQRVAFADGSQWTRNDLLVRAHRALGSEGSDTLAGTAWNDTLQGLGGNDLMFGDDGDDRLEGGNGVDALYGAAGADTLVGGAEADILYGGQGDDVLDGGPGNESYGGEAGSDTYLMGRGDGRDVLAGVDVDAALDVDTLQFKPGVRPEDVRVVTSDGRTMSLVIADDGATLVLPDTLIGGGSGLAANFPLQQVRFDDGLVWTAADLIQRLAFVAPGSAGNP